MIEWIKSHYIWLSIGLVALLIITGVVLQPEDAEAEVFVKSEESERIELKTYIYVDLKGAVENPGVYKVESGSRLFQVVNMAGGLLTEADQNAINLSMILADQDVIYVPLVGEEVPIVIQEDNGTIGGVVNINTATLEQLESLNGIGPSTAQKIIDYRMENGNFSTIEEIMNVSGIGESTFNQIKESITV